MGFLEYAPAPESRSILALKDEYGLFIDGEFVEGRGASFATISPADESRIAMIAHASDEDVDLAVAAARRAYTKVWSKMSGRCARSSRERFAHMVIACSTSAAAPKRSSCSIGRAGLPSICC